VHEQLLPGSLVCRTPAGDFERYGLVQYESFSNECSQTTFAEITRPALQAKFLAVPQQTNPNSRLEQVLVNLLDNANKYTPAGYAGRKINSDGPLIPVFNEVQGGIRIG